MRCAFLPSGNTLIAGPVCIVNSPYLSTTLFKSSSTLSSNSGSMCSRTSIHVTNSFGSGV